MQPGFTFPSLDIGDFVSLDNAIRPYLELCRKEVAAGNTYPFKVDLERLTRLQERILASERVVSEYVRDPKAPPPDELFIPEAET
ncbi:MAG: hypothetical protein ACK4TP_14150 [Hyphomicrobium sp.]